MKGDAQRMLNVLTTSEARKTEFVKKHFFQINTPAPPTAKVSLPGGPHSHQELWGCWSALPAWAFPLHPSSPAPRQRKRAKPTFPEQQGCQHTWG